MYGSIQTGASLLLIACTGKLSIVRMLVDKYAVVNPAFLDEPGQVNIVLIYFLSSIFNIIDEYRTD